MVKRTDGGDTVTIQGLGGASDEMDVEYQQHPRTETDFASSNGAYDSSFSGIINEKSSPEVNRLDESLMKVEKMESIAGVVKDVEGEIQGHMTEPAALAGNAYSLSSTTTMTMDTLAKPENSSGQHSIQPNSTFMESMNDAGDHRVVLQNGVARSQSTTTSTSVQSKKPVLTGFRTKKVEKSPMLNLSASPSMGLTTDGGANSPMDSNTSSSATNNSVLGNQNQSFRTSSNTSPIIRPLNMITGSQGMTRPISVAGAAGNLKQTNQQIHRPQNNTTDRGHNMIRELKVEDALQYLDQVKLEFGDNPTVYNTFLEIMKQFKSQELDTPGVIKKVSTLFRGYNKLILGFNTFLPDGYKIELKDLENLSGRPDSLLHPDVPSRNQKGNPSGGTFANRRPPNWPPLDYETTANKQNGPSTLISHDSHTVPGRQSNIDSNPPVPPMQVRPLSIGQQQRSEMVSPMTGNRQGHTMLPTDSKHMVSTNSLGRTFNPVTIPPGPQQNRSVISSAQQVQQPPVEFDAAIAYVTTIKQRFAKDPRTYQAFLEILHTYQQEQRGIREVLEQVSALFSEHPDLLREFAHFLPEAVQEQAREKLQRAAAEAEARIPKTVKSKGNNSSKGPLPPPPSEANLSSQGMVLPEHVNHTTKQTFKVKIDIFDIRDV